MDDAQSYTVFLSHAAADIWVARQLSSHIENCGASTFLDEADIEYGDDFEVRILQAVRSCHELLVLLTPWSINRPYIWLEIGAIWGQNKRIVGVLYGLTAKELVSQDGTPALLKRIDLVELNRIEPYFEQLKGRIERMGRNDA
jgi:hypothetical protein